MIRHCEVTTAWRSVCIVLVVLVTSSGCNRDTPDPEVKEPPPGTQVSEVTLDEARRQIAAGQFDAARTLISRYLQDHPNDPLALEMAGDGAVQADDATAAIGFYQAAVAASEQPTKQVWLKWAGATVNAQRPFETIAVLRQAVQDYPSVLEIRQNLASLLARVGLQHEAAEHLRWLVQHKYGSQSILLILADLNRPQTHAPTCESALRCHPEDLRPMFSLAQLDASQSKWNEVEQALQAVLARHPRFVPALALYGRALVELDRTEAVRQWSQSLPPQIEGDPQYWLSAGIWASRHGATEQAARAYWTAVRLDENDPEALQGLSASLAKLGRTEQARIAADRAEKIAMLRSHTTTLATWDYDSQTAVVDLARTLDDLGRLWEATSWLMLGASMQQHPDPRWEQTLRKIRAELKGSTPWQLPGALVSTKLDLSSIPEVVWRQSSDEVSPSSAEPADPNRSHVGPAVSEKRTAPAFGDGLGMAAAFRDEAVRRSLSHVCAINKPDDQEAGLMIYQSGAGGAGVIDFDLDGWPDLYLTVMDGTPNRQDSRPNRLYRNHAGKFSDVTAAASLIDRGFAQGVSVGDYDADGWPDVYVANIGPNRLYRNNGDGTFQEVTELCGLGENDPGGSRWTTSVAIADLNGDGQADIYEVGYCRGEQPMTLECIDPSIDQPRSCNPIAFDAEPDRIWAGNGDGTFDDATDWLGPHEPGRGFALVVGDLDGRGGLETYVANDMTANHFWANRDGGNALGLSEQAGIRGLAFNRRSAAQASMGIAAADADRDGDIDFLLTHFVDDHNTYYRQDSPGIWSDESQVAGFAESSQSMLAYGTQWIDVDNDGSLEVFIANGDIDDFRFQGRAFRQRAQLLEQVTHGRWQVTPADRLGDYFRVDKLGRAVATLDANRDGRCDLIVTHLFDPVALLVNQTETADRQTRFFLRARSTHRDAIGTRIRFTTSKGTFEQSLLAGNGFQCVNEACVAFGTGDVATLRNVRVTWPDGINESLGELAGGTDYLVTQGAGVWRLDN
ncbi:FG-GAP-like repeat-containing protein [Rhodopirellula sp. JC639]|uniref:FG-GAP-like repeat-containing protein n=1 Tax=Stieleria mannarensis TaxID=2755585 RepID=UPI0016009A03|nr:FG-GAP-like repeat-containing protein [Rhodopirellula sp. JC639]